MRAAEHLLIRNPLLSLSQSLIQVLVKLLQAGNAMHVVDRNPGQPGAVRANASHSPPAHAPVLLLPAGTCNLRIGIIYRGKIRGQAVPELKVLTPPLPSNTMGLTSG